ncbi:MAG TPA: MptD family putative ECF transporter S component [Clostridiales bacterium]|nr:MptD family putative ECF transporter S component [Clostridiales bacterium]
MSKKKLDVKDLINVGIFSAIYYILLVVAGFLGYIPIFSVLFPIVVALLCGIPFVLFLTKTKTFGLITIMGVLLGILNLAFGAGWYSIITGLLCGLLADLICKAGEYKSWKHMVACFCVFSEWVIGSMLPMWIMKDSYFAMISDMQGAAFAESLESLVTGWMLALLMVLTAVAAIIGAYLGKAVLKKHFVRAGIA